MMRSMFAGVTGLRSHQVAMDVIGNNIANVNTVGFKGGRVIFQDVFSQTLRSASGPQLERGGTNAMQVGLGMTMASIDVLHTPGSMQFTGRDTDMSVEGDGFFILREGGINTFTRAGNFGLDSTGYLVSPTGARVQGWMAHSDGTFGPRDQNSIGDVRIPAGEAVLAEATSRIVLARNLDAGAPVGTMHATSVDAFDSLGRQHSIKVVLVKDDAGVWSWGVPDPDDPDAYLGSGPTEGPYAAAPPSSLPGSAGVLLFEPDGTLTDDDDIADNSVTGTVTIPLDDTDDLVITLDFTALTQSAAPEGSTVIVSDRNGMAMGTLESYAVDSAGVISGVYSNGLRRPLAQVALAVFTNRGGLMRTGANSFIDSNNSGLPEIGAPGTGARGRVAPSNLEMSNVDLSQEFTSMITTQRGFQANSRVITTSDEMLQELVNIKR